MPLMVYTRTDEQTRRMEEALASSHTMLLCGLDWMIIWGVMGEALRGQALEPGLREALYSVYRRVGRKLFREAILTVDETGRPCLWPDEQEQKNRGETG